MTLASPPPTPPTHSESSIASTTPDFAPKISSPLIFPPHTRVEYKRAFSSSVKGDHHTERVKLGHRRTQSYSTPSTHASNLQARKNSDLRKMPYNRSSSNIANSREYYAAPAYNEATLLERKESQRHSMRGKTIIPWVFNLILVQNWNWKCFLVSSRHQTIWISSVQSWWKGFGRRLCKSRFRLHWRNTVNAQRQITVLKIGQRYSLRTFAHVGIYVRSQANERHHSRSVRTDLAVHERRRELCAATVSVVTGTKRTNRNHTNTHWRFCQIGIENVGRGKTEIDTRRKRSIQWRWERFRSQPNCRNWSFYFHFRNHGGRQFIGQSQEFDQRSAIKVGKQFRVARRHCRRRCTSRQRQRYAWSASVRWYFDLGFDRWQNRNGTEHWQIVRTHSGEFAFIFHHRVSRAGTSRTAFDTARGRTESVSVSWICSTDWRWIVGIDAEVQCESIPWRLGAMSCRAVLSPESTAEMSSRWTDENFARRTNHSCDWRRSKRCVDDSRGTRWSWHCRQRRKTSRSMCRLFVCEFLHAQKSASRSWTLFHKAIVAAGALFFLQKFSFYADAGNLQSKLKLIFIKIRGTDFPINLFAGLLSNEQSIFSTNHLWNSFLDTLQCHVHIMAHFDIVANGKTTR